MRERAECAIVTRVIAAILIDAWTLVTAATLVATWIRVIAAILFDTRKLVIAPTLVEAWALVIAAILVNARKYLARVQPLRLSPRALFSQGFHDSHDLGAGLC